MDANGGGGFLLEVVSAVAKAMDEVCVLCSDVGFTDEDPIQPRVVMRERNTALEVRIYYRRYHSTEILIKRSVG